MDDKITLDRETFKALAVDTRVRILKILDERQHTLTDLSEELGLAPSTIKEHLDTLVAAGLIQQIDKGMKWKYYRLTSKGKKIVNPYEKKVLIVLATSVLVLAASVYSLLERLASIVPEPIRAPIAQTLNDGDSAAGGMLEHEEAADTMIKATGRYLDDATTSTLPEVLWGVRETVIQIPYFETGMVIVSALVLGVCVGYLIRRKRAI